ncbi:hypothetical protein Vadar_028463 [Vaccinium darrowii]|uniref:Uncharacterized protein n=1 Tax=Vaccinium darrowii TaxID=229202 RepID=A0ACB7XTZ6_9ERIC|nr:hypothetical protein Vadar_028463 [Vaccinium darrowii]
MLPFHREHPLTLSKDPPPPFNDGIFYCCLCMTPGDGFSYICAECDKFVLHVHCALRTPMEIRDAGHQHLLALERHAYTGLLKCRACRRSCEEVSFLCRNHKCRNRFGFALHVNCVALSPRKKCGSHRHTLTLVYNNVEQESYVYYCNACEEERDPEAWVYRCEHEKCEYFAHTNCEPIFPFLELGGSRKIESHDHPVTLTARIGDVNRALDHGVLSGLRYECTECTYELDLLVDTFNYSGLE